MSDKESPRRLNAVERAELVMLMRRYQCASNPEEAAAARHQIEKITYAGFFTDKATS